MPQAQAAGRSDASPLLAMAVALHVADLELDPAGAADGLAIF
jgi:hypothetical protein